MIKIGGSRQSSSALLAYPGLGYAAGSEWRIRISGVVWQTPVVFNMRQRMMIRMLGGVMQASPDQLTGEMFQSRITPFMAEADHRQSILVTLGGRTIRLKKRTRRNGHFFDWLRVKSVDLESSIEERQGTRVVPFTVGLAGSDHQPFEGQIFLHARQGVSVISDIDDTIKDSSVSERRELLANTFLREFRSIEGMADVYQDWAAQGASFHYVSSSPWQLFSSLQRLHADHHFPNGSMHLRNFRLRDQLLKRVIIRRKGKANAIKMLFNSMPDREFILVGDSGEKDPKIYRKICRQFPGRVRAVFVRDLESRPLEDESFQKLCGSLPNGTCAKFSTADQLRELSASVIGPLAITP